MKRKPKPATSAREALRHRVPARPSAEAEAQDRRRKGSATHGRFKSLERFHYWRIPEINPWTWEQIPGGMTPADWSLMLSMDTHAELERQYGNAHRGGDVSALFDYARIDSWCFRSAWFVEQLEIWRDQGMDAKLRKVMASFTRNVSKTPTAKLRKTIARDQAILRRLTDRPTGQSLFTWFGVLADEFDVGDDVIRDVHEAYEPYYRDQIAAGISSPTFFDRLAAMLKRLP